MSLNHADDKFRKAEKYAHREDDVFVPPEGLVKLSDKMKPVHLGFQDDGNSIEDQNMSGSPWVFTRAVMDTSSLKDMIINLPKEIWEDEYQAEHNVGLKRPAHDDWGIKKIVFVFCDDYLKRVYDLPWFHAPEWRAHLDPIFEQLNLRPDKIVRCLLASIPPGVTIPPHHDTGYWVRFTHRLHVPIITNEEVIFRAGPHESKMARVLFDEGRIVELNNQCKHYVHNGWDQNRIHLIFDYVEDFPIQRVQLQPGEKLTQTRRSVDLASEQGSRPIPSFLIIGAQKAGTTSLYEYLNQHNLVLRARRRESHYFDWRWQSHLKNTKQHRQFYERFFHNEMLELHPSLLTGESTPSYLLNFSTVIPRLLRVLPHRPKIIVTLRDPVKRAYSQYQMIQDPDGTPEQKRARGQSELLGVSFEEVVMAEIQELNNLGITPETTSEEFAKLYLSTRPMNHGGHSLIGRGLYALQLQPWLDEFERGSEILVLKMEDMKTLENTQAQMDKIFNFLGIPSETVEDKEAKNSRKYEPMDESIMNILYEFYQPFNQKLSGLIGNNFEWKRS